MDEHSLIRAAREGDLDAFNTLVLQYQDYLFNVALHMTADEDLSADALQEALLSAFRHIRAFRGGGFRSWLTRITINACYDELRRKSRRPSQRLEWIVRDGGEIDLNDWLYDPAPGTEYQVETSELETAIHAALRSLSAPYRAAVVLVDIQGYSYDEAAKILRVPVGTVRSRLARARANLRSLLGEVEDLMPVPVWFNIGAGSYQVPTA